MVEIDYCVRDLTVSHKGIFDFNELYKVMKDWFNLHKYEFYEVEYHDVLKTDEKDIRCKWVAERKVDEYTKFAIEIEIKLDNHKLVEVKKSGKKAKLSSCSLKVIITSYLKQDYQEKWEGPVKKFVRGLHDKFISKEKYSRYEDDLKEETYNIFNEIKAYLNLQKFE